MAERAGKRGGAAITHITILIDAALGYLQRGWSVVPIRNEGESKACRIRWERFQTARPTEAQVRRWFKAGHKTGLAVITGEVSGGLYCRDFDDPDSYSRWAIAHPDLAETMPTAQTGKGFHVWGVWPGVGFADLGDGELRGDNLHYTLLPPSLHPSGLVYKWTVPLPKGDLPSVDPREAQLGRNLNKESTDSARTKLLSQSATPSSPTCVTESPESSESLCLCISVYRCFCVSVSLTDPRIQAAMDATMPGEGGKRNRLIFDYLRRLKGMPEFALATTTQICPYVREWHRQALPALNTKSWDDTWVDAARGWGSIRWPHGEGPFAEALERAKNSSDPECAKGYEREEVQLLIRLCLELAKLHAPEPFFLPCRSAGEAVGLNRTEACRFLGMLCIDGVLLLVRKGHSGWASEYRYSNLTPQPTPIESSNETIKDDEVEGEVQP